MSKTSIRWRVSWQKNLYWIDSLPQRTGIFCHEDNTGRYLRTELHNLGRQDLGVIAAGDTSTASETNLSSVRLSYQLIGEQLGVRLQKLFSSNHWENALIPPIGISKRASTETAHVDSWLNNIRKWVAEDPKNRKDVQGLAQHLNISRKTLHRQCLRHAGQTPKDILHTWRLQWAREAVLTNNKQTIRHIAQYYGWCDSAHFIRDFRKAFGTTPGALHGLSAP
jgi:AraC-like DNA-binding protein